MSGSLRAWQVFEATLQEFGVRQKLIAQPHIYLGMWCAYYLSAYCFPPILPHKLSIFSKASSGRQHQMVKCGRLARADRPAWLRKTSWEKLVSRWASLACYVSTPTAS